MKKLLVGLTLALAGSLLAVPATPAAAAAPMPAVTKEYARKMKCRYPERSSLAGGGPNTGVECRVISRRGRQTFYILRYRNTTRAMDFWRDWLKPWSEGDAPRYIARKGRIFIIPMAGGSGVDNDAYTKKWASYAARKLDGRIVAGYPY